MRHGDIVLRETTMPNFSFHILSWLIAVVAFAGSLGEVAIAQKKASPARFAVDLVTLDSGNRLRGAFAGVDADGVVSMAVQREWLKNSKPVFYEEVTHNESTEAKAAATELRARIQKWLDEKPESNAVVTFLEVERERVDEQLAKLNEARGGAGTSQFVMLKFPRREAKYSFAQSTENRRIAMLAWRERFPDVETREAADLEQQLRERGIDPAVDFPDLAGRLPVVRQDENEWAARRAVIEYELVGKLDFQGIGSALVRTDGGAGKVGLEQLLPQILPQLLQDQVGGQLADLLQEPGLPRPRGAENSTPDLSGAIREAERAGRKGFRVTTVELNLQRKQAKVETRFVAKLSTGKWETIWHHNASGDPSKPRPDAQRQIENDPQVAEALKLVKSLGLGTGGQLQTAMNFGAATMEAQKAADQEFFRFLDRYFQRLDGPALKWSSGDHSVN
tara:strand:+ start:46259 stop:47605 length:1347 start_codon:yes stop_codon:yes gene_type:complete